MIVCVRETVRRGTVVVSLLRLFDQVGALDTSMQTDLLYQASGGQGELFTDIPVKQLHMLYIPAQAAAVSASSASESRMPNRGRRTLVD